MTRASRKPNVDIGPGGGAAEPDPSCPVCPRLVDYRCENQRRYPAYRNAPAPSFGPATAKLLIVGLAPGLHGANRTGRPFTGDFAGDLLYRTLTKFGFARGDYDARADDGLTLVETMITNAVRCAPPANKPTTEEIRACRPFLAARIDSLHGLKAIVCLGRIAHESTLAALALKPKDAPFGHGAERFLPRGVWLFDSYHCSRYNTNTGRLTEAMFEQVFLKVRSRLTGAARAGAAKG